MYVCIVDFSQCPHTVKSTILTKVIIINFFAQIQLSEDSGTLTCFLVYEVRTSVLSEANTSNHGVQIPRAVQYSQSSVHLSLTVDSNLLVNELYLATITAINADGERNTSVTVEFGNEHYNFIQMIKIN